jgi:hypothetical protein
VYVALRDGSPSRIILRDLDSTILDPIRIRPVVRSNRIRLAPATWRCMPPFEVGGRRLAHAMMYGHLGEVMSYLARTARADPARLTADVEDTWSELIGAASPSARKRVSDVYEKTNEVSAVLRRRLTRSTQLVFV